MAAPVFVLNNLLIGWPKRTAKKEFPATDGTPMLTEFHRSQLNTSQLLSSNNTKDWAVTILWEVLLHLHQRTRSEDNSKTGLLAVSVPDSASVRAAPSCKYNEANPQKCNSRLPTFVNSASDPSSSHPCVAHQLPLTSLNPLF